LAPTSALHLVRHDPLTPAHSRQRMSQQERKTQTHVDPGMHGLALDVPAPSASATAGDDLGAAAVVLGHRGLDEWAETEMAPEHELHPQLHVHPFEAAEGGVDRPERRAVPPEVEPLVADAHADPRVHLAVG